MVRTLLAGVAAFAVSFGTVCADEMTKPATTETKSELKSGPQVGEKVTPFETNVVTGSNAGKETCLVCQNGSNPVAVIFARTCECPGLAKLTKALDEATTKNSSSKMGSFIVVLSDEEKIDAKLKKWAETEKLKHLVVSYVTTTTGPTKYNLSKEADITCILYTGKEVKSTFAFKKGEITDKCIETVVADVSKIIPTSTK